MHVFPIKAVSSLMSNNAEIIILTSSYTYDFTCIQVGICTFSLQKSGWAKTRPARPLAMAMDNLPTVMSGCSVFQGMASPDTLTQPTL